MSIILYDEFDNPVGSVPEALLDHPEVIKRFEEMAKAQEEALAEKWYDAQTDPIGDLEDILSVCKPVKRPRLFMMSCNHNDTSGTDELVYLDKYITIHAPYREPEEVEQEPLIKDGQVRQQYGPVKKRGKGKFKKYY